MKAANQTPEEVKQAARELLKDNKQFDEVFERIFKKCDKNFDKKIDEAEYFNFINLMLKDLGKKALNFETTNQRLYEVVAHMDDGRVEKKDITYKFWRK